jgi:hypothetical protein
LIHNGFNKESYSKGKKVMPSYAWVMCDGSFFSRNNRGGSDSKFISSENMYKKEERMYKKKAYPKKLQSI